MSLLTRRQSFAVVTATLGAPFIVKGLPAFAQEAMSTPQNAAFYRRKLGDTVVTALSDGYLDVATSLVQGVSPQTIQTALEAAHIPAQDSFRIGITSYVVDTGSQVFLVDSGAEGFFGPTAGRFAQTLNAAGYNPDQIDAVFVTHMHPDHIAALVAGNQPVFNNAALYINTQEFNFWTSETNKAGAPESMHSWFDLASLLASAYRGKITLFQNENDLPTGFEPVSLSGHTPGHTGFVIGEGNQRLLIAGDVCAVAALQFSHPDAGLIFDLDSSAAQKTRRALLDRVSSEKMLMTGAHLPFPAFGYVDRRNDEYAWVPEEHQYI